MQKIKQAICLSALSMLLTACCSEPIRYWKLENNCGYCPMFESARMYLKPANQFAGIELEFVWSPYGLRLYLNVSGLQIPSNPCDPTTSLVFISFKDHSYSFAAPRFQGGQRLLIPDDVRNEIVSYMQDEQTVFIQTGSYQADISPCEFLAIFNRLMKGC